MKETSVDLCLDNEEQENMEIKRRETKRFEFDDVFEETASKYCKEIKQKHKDYRAECHRQSNNQTPNLKQETHIMSQASSQGSSRQKHYKKTQNSRQMSRESIVSTKTVVLVGENSCSLIKIPNYLGSELSSCSDTTSSRPRLQLDLTKEATSTQAARRTQKPALCITCIMSVVVLTAMAAIILILSYLT